MGAYCSVLGAVVPDDITRNACIAGYESESDSDPDTPDTPDTPGHPGGGPAPVRRRKHNPSPELSHGIAHRPFLLDVAGPELVLRMLYRLQAATMRRLRHHTRRQAMEWVETPRPWVMTGRCQAGTRAKTTRQTRARPRNPQMASSDRPRWTCLTTRIFGAWWLRELPACCCTQAAMRV
jgi:hypothetical protein